MLNKVLGKFSRDLGIDLGTANTLVYVKDRGIVINEPSVVAINNKTDQILAVGVEAKKMFGKTPPHIEVSRPMVEGVISDFEVTEKMLKYFIDKVHSTGFKLMPRPMIVIGIPLEVTEVERKAVEDAAVAAGARQVFLIEEAIAAAIGTRLPIQEASANMIIDIGGGTTEIAVISLSGVVTSKSVRIAGDELNRNIVQYVRDEFNLLIGEKLAEEVKVKVGTVIDLDDPLEMKLRGRDLITGLPKEIVITSAHVNDAISRTIKNIIDNVKMTLEITPPELVADIYEKGILLCGGGALLRGIEKYIQKIAQIPVKIVDDPLTCVARGTGIILENKELQKQILSPSSSLDKL